MIVLVNKIHVRGLMIRNRLVYKEACNGCAKKQEDSV
jgi:hypothetical protein